MLENLLTDARYGRELINDIIFRASVIPYLVEEGDLIRSDQLLERPPTSKLLRTSSWEIQEQYARTSSRTGGYVSQDGSVTNPTTILWFAVQRRDRWKI